jgi:hypothetical protein
MASSAFSQLSLAPLGAGDLIDRTARLYRRHFITLIRIAALPVVVSVMGSVLLMVGTSGIAATASDWQLILGGALILAGLVIWAVGNLLFLVVLGGAARNLVANLLWGEPVSVRATYRSVRARFWGLLGATFLMIIAIIFSGGIAFYAWLMSFWIMAGMVAVLISVGAPIWLAAALGIVLGLAVTAGALWLFFWLAGRVVYVPQIMLVEGKGVAAAINRSAHLARGNVRRLAALVMFSIFAYLAAVMLLLVPLRWYAYLHGIDPLTWNAADLPIWYQLGSSALVQSSSILLAPVLMIGLSLLYVDERVRHEGYDIELMAAQRLGPIPTLAGGQETPLAPALAAEPGLAPPPGPTSGSVLGLR